MNTENAIAGCESKGINLSSIKEINERNDQVSLSEGEIAMDVHFKPSQRKDVFSIKLWSAMMYDWMIKECSKVNEDLEKYNRKQRLKSIALTHLETFQMNAVKSVTFTEEFQIEQRPERKILSPTDGEVVMNCAFNVGGRVDIMFIKRCCALVYDDMIEEVLLRRNDFKAKATDFEKNYKDQPLTSWPEEIIMDQRKLEFSVQAMEESLYSLRQFQLFAVKAVTR